MNLKSFSFSLVCLTSLMICSCSNSSSGLVIKQQNVELFENEKTTLTAYVNGSAKNTYLISWKSSDENVAQVSSYSGVVEGINPGTAIITATISGAQVGGKTYTATCEVTVKREQGFDYQVGNPTGFIREGNYFMFNIPVKNTGNVNLYFYSSLYEITNKYGDELYESYFNMYAYPRLIAPGETGYLFDSPYSSSFQGKTPDDLVVVPHLKIKAAKNTKCERYTVSMSAPSERQFGGVSIEGTVINNSNERIAKPRVGVHVYNKSNQFMTTLYYSFVEGINPGESQTFTVSIDSYGSTKIDLDEIGDVVAIAYDDVTVE